MGYFYISTRCGRRVVLLMRTNRNSDPRARIEVTLLYSISINLNEFINLYIYEMGKLCMNPLIITVPPLAPRQWTGNQLNVEGPTVIRGMGCEGSV